MSAYRLLFAIDIRHSYFADGWCDALRIRPTPSCDYLMRQYRLLFKVTRQGGELYYDATAQRPGAPGSLLGFAARGAFTFIIESVSAGLEKYTAIDAQPVAAPGASLYYFDNLHGGSASLNGVVHPLLHPAGEPFALGALPWKPRRFGYAADAPVSSLTALTAQSRVPVWGPTAIVPPASQVALALTSAPEGRYLLAAPGVADYAFYLSDISLNGAFAIAAIHPRGADGHANHAACIDSKGNVMPQRYTIALSARALVWRYFIVPHNSQTHNDWRIDATVRCSAPAGGEAPLTFTRATQMVLLGSRAAVMFSSSRPLIVSQRPASELTIRLEGSGLAQPLVLPFPELTQSGVAMAIPLSRDESSATNRDNLADVYVYL